MSKVKYYFDPDTLSYRPIKATNKNRILNVLLFTFLSFFFGIICLLILLNSDFLNTPSEVAQKRTIQNYELQFEILNKKLSQLETVVANVEERDNNIYRVYFEASPIPEEQRYAGFGGVNRYKDLEGYDNSELIINTTKLKNIMSDFQKNYEIDCNFIKNSERRKKKLLIADMDSTIIKEESLDELAKLIGKDKEVSFITNEAMNGRIEFKRALIDRVSILKGNPANILETLKNNYKPS